MTLHRRDLIIVMQQCWMYDEVYSSSVSNNKLKQRTKASLMKSDYSNSFSMQTSAKK